jgi:hypothetical protein
MVKRVFVLAAAMLLAGLASAHASIRIEVDKSSQHMSVVVDGTVRYLWAVSTGRAHFGTPNGTYRPQRMARSWFSKEYYNSPMPYSIFFHRGYAIHGSYEISRLGGPASHGCIRLHPGNAATLFALVQQEGMGNTIISVSGQNPAPRAARAIEGQPGDEGQTYRDNSPGYAQPPAYGRPAPSYQPYFQGF